MGKSETEALPLLEDWEQRSFIDPDGRAFSEIIKHERRKVGMTHDSGHAVKKNKQTSRKGLQGRKLVMTKVQKQCTDSIVESNESTRQRAPSLQSPNHEARIAWKNYFDDTLQFGAQVYSNATNYEKFRMQKLPWTRNGQSSRQYQHDNWTESRARKRWSMKHEETKIMSTLPHWWTYVTLKNEEFQPELQKYKGRVVLWVTL